VEILTLSLGQGKRHKSLTQETLKVPRITTYGLLRDESLEVLQVNTVEKWITPYQRYLGDGLLPVESTKVNG